MIHSSQPRGTTAFFIEAVSQPLYIPRHKVKYLFGVFLLLLFNGTACHADGRLLASFRPGEKLHYNLFWGPLVVGRATFEVRGLETLDGHECYHLVATAQTIGPGRLLYRLDSRIESWLDTTANRTYCARIHHSEPRKTRHEELWFDYSRQQLVVTNLLQQSNSTRALAGDSVDLLGLVYAARRQPLNDGAMLQFRASVADQDYDVRLKPIERRSLMLRPVGELPAWRVEPDPPLSFVRAHQGRMWLWVSDDPRRIPLLAVSALKIGNARMVLAKIETETSPAQSFWRRPASCSTR